MTHLYLLTEQMQGLQALIDEGEMDAETLQDTLDGLTTDLQAKGEGVLYVLANLNGNIKAYTDEIKRMTARKKTLENHHNWLKEYLRTNMVDSGITKIECPLFTASLKKAAKMVEITSEKLLPTNYKTLVPASWTVNKAQILNDLKAGIEIPGAGLTDAKQGLTIK